MTENELATVRRQRVEIAKMLNGLDVNRNEKGMLPFRAVSMAYTSLEKSRMWMGNMLKYGTGNTGYAIATSVYQIPAATDLPSLEEGYVISLTGDPDAILGALNSVREDIKKLAGDLMQMDRSNKPREFCLSIDEAWKNLVEAGNSFGLSIAELRKNFHKETPPVLESPRYPVTTTEATPPVSETHTVNLENALLPGAGISPGNLNVSLGESSSVQPQSGGLE